jgi:hypothetical protein
MLKGAGTAAPICAVLAWAWWAERTERKEQNDKLWAMMSQAVAAEQGMAHSLDLLAAKIK